MKKSIAIFLASFLFLGSFFPFLQTPLAPQKVYAEENCIYYVYDGQGNIRFVTDEVGNKVRSTEYDPFGNWRAAKGQSNITILYQSQQLDPESSLYYLRARYYDPLIGRFISRDPVRGTLTNPQTQNPYAYSLNNPISLSDPSGKHAVDDGSIIWGEACGGFSFDHYHPAKPGYAYEGDVLGNVGNSGNSSGPHLHFEVFNDGTSVDPQTYLDSGTLSSPIGGPYAQTSWHNVAGHQGVDYAVNRNDWANGVNTPIYAATDGSIQSNSNPNGYGNYVQQTTNNQVLEIIYGHMQ